MCYSVKLWAEYQQLTKHYGGEISWVEFRDLVTMRERAFDLHDSLSIEIPDELISGLVAQGGSAAKEIAFHQR